MNDIMALATEEIVDAVLQGADCRHGREDDVEYSLHPLHEKSTVEEVYRLVNKAIRDWLRKFVNESIRDGDDAV